MPPWGSSPRFQDLEIMPPNTYWWDDDEAFFANWERDEDRVRPGSYLHTLGKARRRAYTSHE